MNRETIVWGIFADGTGIVQNDSDRVETLPGGGVRVERRSLLAHEPASDYARSHPAPLPMCWQHEEQVGRIVALRRAHGNLYAIGRSDLDPEELESLAGEHGLKWSTKTDNRRGEPLRIVEISLTPEPATVGLPPVSWWKSNTSRGDPPWWVRVELDRGEKVEHRSRGELRVHEFSSEGSDGYEHRTGDFDKGTVEIFHHPGGRIIAVEGRPVR